MEDNKVITAEQISATIERINNLAGLRGEIERKKHAVEVHERDLKSIEKINGVDSNEWKIKNDILTSAKKELEETENKVSELSFTKSLYPSKGFELEEYKSSNIVNGLLLSSTFGSST